MIHFAPKFFFLHSLIFKDGTGVKGVMGTFEVLKNGLNFNDHTLLQSLSVKGGVKPKIIFWVGGNGNTYLQIRTVT